MISENQAFGLDLKEDFAQLSCAFCHYLTITRKTFNLGLRGNCTGLIE